MMGILRRIITTETVGCTLIFYVLSGSFTDAQTNIALNKPATQSSTYIRQENPFGGGPSGPRVAGIAVDGDPLPAQCVNVNDLDGLWSHTEIVANSWWMVDLGEKYYIYDVTICNRGRIFGFRLDRSQLLFSIKESNAPSDPDPTDTDNWKVIDTISVNTLDLIQIPELPGEISLARHVAIFNADPNSVTLREVTVTGFTDEEKNAIVLNHGVKPTSFNISLTANITGFNSSVFAPSRLKLYNHTDGNRIELEDISVTEGSEMLQIVMPDLTPQSNFSLEIELISNQFLLATQSFLLSTPEFICEDPAAVERIDVIQTSDSCHEDRPVKLTVSWPIPKSTGCELLPDQVLTYEVTIDGNLTVVMEQAMVVLYVEAYTNYSIVIGSLNSQRKASKETRTNLVTMPTAPGDAPTGVSVAALNQTCVYVGWAAEPRRTNGPISKYEVSCIASGNDIITSVMPLNFPTSVDICNSHLKAGVRVSCSVTAFTTNNQIYLKGPDSAVESTLMHVDLDVDIEQTVVKQGANGIFPVPIPVVTPPPGFELIGYRVVLSNQDHQARWSQNSLCSHVIIPERARSPTFDPLLNYSDAQACNLNNYLAAVLTEAPEPGYRFPVGDGLMYSGVYNTRLKEGSAYYVYYGVNVRVKGETDVYVQMLGTPVASFEVAVNQSTTSGEFEEKGSQGGLSSGAVTGITISTAVIAGVIIVVVVALLLKKKQLKQQELADKDGTKSKNLGADEPSDYEDLQLGSQSAYKAGLDLEETLNGHDYAKLDVQHSYESATTNALPTTEEHHYTTMDSQYEMLSSPNNGDAHVYAESTAIQG